MTQFHSPVIAPVSGIIGSGPNTLQVFQKLPVIWHCTVADSGVAVKFSTDSGMNKYGIKFTSLKILCTGSPTETYRLHISGPSTGVAVPIASFDITVAYTSVPLDDFTLPPNWEIYGETVSGEGAELSLFGGTLG